MNDPGHTQDGMVSVGFDRLSHRNRPVLRMSYDQLFATLQQKINDGVTLPLPPFTRRDIYLPAVPNKVLAVIGMRRAGKTYFLWKCLADKVAAGYERSTLLYFNFEDERLAGLQASDLL